MDKIEIRESTIKYWYASGAIENRSKVVTKYDYVRLAIILAMAAAIYFVIP